MQVQGMSVASKANSKLRLLAMAPAGWAIAATMAWLILLWGILADFSVRALGRQFNQLPQMPLNELGDFLAGVIAPIGLIWLIATVWLQLRSLQASNRAFDASQENAFKLGLFEKRYEVKNRFQDAVWLLQLDKEQQKRAIESLAEAAGAADYLFGSNIRENLRELLDKAHRARFYDLEYEFLQPKSSRTMAEQRRLDAAINGRDEIARWMVDLSRERITEMFRPYLEMPEPREATRRGSRRR